MNREDIGKKLRGNGGLDEKAGDGEEINMAPEAKGQQMSTDKQNAGRIRSSRLYAGGRFMTLIEILIAIGILALGMMGIMSLVPVAIRHTSAALQNSTGGSVAQTAITSLQSYSLDMSDPNNEDMSLHDVDKGLNTENTIVIPDDLVWDDPDTPTHVDTDENFVRYMVDGDTTKYGWHAVLEPESSEQSTGNYVGKVKVWHKARAEVDTVMDVSVGDPVTFDTDEHNLLVDEDRQDYVRIWYDEDVDIKNGQKIYIAEGFKWVGGDDVQKYMPVKEIKQEEDEGGGNYVRFETTREVESFENSESKSRVVVNDNTHFVGEYTGKIKW